MESAKLGSCRLCGQGELLVAQQLATGEFFLVCEECEGEWDGPVQSRDVELVAALTHGPYRIVSSEEVANCPAFSVWSAGPFP